MSEPRMLRHQLLVAATVLATCGCVSTVTHAPANAQDDSTGIRYYRSSPYLLIYSDNKGGLQWQILYLPDQSKLMTASPFVLGGRTEMTLFFNNGVLIGSSELGDTTELPKAIVAAVQAAVPLLLAAAGATPNEVSSPYLYKVVVNGDSVQFYGHQGLDKIRVPYLRGTTP
jgi:hypothetical protein